MIIKRIEEESMSINENISADDIIDCLRIARSEMNMNLVYYDLPIYTIDILLGRGLNQR